MRVRDWFNALRELFSLPFGAARPPATGARLETEDRTCTVRAVIRLRAKAQLAIKLESELCV